MLQLVAGEIAAFDERRRSVFFFVFFYSFFGFLKKKGKKSKTTGLQKNKKQKTLNERTNACIFRHRIETTRLPFDSG